MSIRDNPPSTIMIDSTKPEYQSLVNADEPRPRDGAMWFDNGGMGPSIHDWTTRAFMAEDADSCHIGIEFHGLGGPFMTMQTAERLSASLVKAIETAKAGTKP